MSDHLQYTRQSDEPPSKRAVLEMSVEQYDEIVKEAIETQTVVAVSDESEKKDPSAKAPSTTKMLLAIV